MVIALSVALVLTTVYGAFQKIACLALSAYLHKKDIVPSDADMKHCVKYVVKRLLGRKPQL